MLNVPCLASPLPLPLPPLPLPPPFSPPPPPPPPTIAATTAAVATAPKVSFRDDMVKLFELKFYVDPVLLKTIHSYLNIKILFKLILLATLYLCKNSLECKAKSLLKTIKNINDIIVRQLSKKAIKSNNEVRAFISILQEYVICSLKNINNINKHCFELKLCREL